MHVNCTLHVQRGGRGGGAVRVSGDGGELFEQDVLTQCVQRDVLPHIQADGAHLQEQTFTTVNKLCFHLNPDVHTE